MKRELVEGLVTGVAVLLAAIFTASCFWELNDMSTYFSLIREAGYTGLSPYILCIIMFFNGGIFGAVVYDFFKMAKK